MAKPISVEEYLDRLKKRHPNLVFLERKQGEELSREQFTEYWQIFCWLGKVRTASFTFDEANKYTFMNLIRWAMADPKCEAIDPDTGQSIPADLTKGIYICGKTGTGKSVTLDVLREFVRECRGAGCFFNGEYHSLSWQNMRADEIVDKFCNGENMSALKKLPMLGIQDLGTEPTDAIYMGNRQELMRLILESRADYSTMTFVTSNFEMISPEIRQKYGERVQSRFRQMFNYYILGGEDRRMSGDDDKNNE